MYHVYLVTGRTLSSDTVRGVHGSLAEADAQASAINSAAARAGDNSRLVRTLELDIETLELIVAKARGDE